MKLTKYMALAALSITLWGCQEDPVLPPSGSFLQQARHISSILDFKEAHWQDAANYVDSITTDADGNDVYLRGRVISSDASGNIYKSIMISDSTAAITIAVNAYDLNKTFVMGQEVVVKATGLKVGRYNNLMQLGGEGTFNNAPSMTFMTEDDFKAHFQGVGRPDAALVDTIATDLDELTNAKNTAEGLIDWQSRLIRIDGLTFENAGEQFAPSGNTNRYLKDANGKRINLRCSSYADFAKDVIPAGTGSVTGILSYYGNDWQMLLIDLDGLKGFSGTPETPDVPSDGGTREKPYTVTDVLAMGNPGTAAWVEGTIVGVMNYTEGTGNWFSATRIDANSNVVIAASAADYGTDYVAVQLPAGDLRSALNLKDHPENIGKTLKIQGTLSKYCGIAGIRDCSVAEFDGKEIGTPAPEPGEGVTFTKATELADGTYALWAADKVGVPVTANYGYIKVSDCTPSGLTITTAETNAYIITSTDKGYTIQQSGDKRYLYMTGTYDSFNLDAALGSDNGFYWDITIGADGSASIVNKANQKKIQYDSKFTSFGAYSDDRGTLPVLYKK